MKSRIIYDEICSGFPEAIFYVEGQYVYVHEISPEDYNKQREDCVYRYWVDPQYLYNGRVVIHDQIYLKIDGKDIYREIIDKGFIKRLEKKLTYPVVTEYLNQIVKKGVDSFLADYELKIKTWKDETGDPNCI